MPGGLGVVGLAQFVPALCGRTHVDEREYPSAVGEAVVEPDEAPAVSVPLLSVFLSTTVAPIRPHRGARADVAPASGSCSRAPRDTIRRSATFRGAVTHD